MSEPGYRRLASMDTKQGVVDIVACDDHVAGGAGADASACRACGRTQHGRGEGCALVLCRQGRFCNYCVRAHGRSLSLLPTHASHAIDSFVASIGLAAHLGLKDLLDKLLEGGRGEVDVEVLRR